MKVRELIRALRCFDGELSVTVKDENWPHCETKSIAIVNTERGDCVIETDKPEKGAENEKQS